MLENLIFGAGTAFGILIALCWFGFVKREFVK